VDELDGADVEPARRLRGDQHLGSPTLARDDDLLLVAARQRRAARRGPPPRTSYSSSSSRAARGASGDEPGAEAPACGSSRSARFSAR
jgi:hypothetical protein